MSNGERKEGIDLSSLKPIYRVDPETICPRCGRYIGPLETCPYCGAKIRRKFSLWLLKRLALVLAIVSVLILYSATLAYEPPYITISDINPTMNYALVRIKGWVLSSTDPYYSNRTGSPYITFTIADGTYNKMYKMHGVQIRCYSQVAELMYQWGYIPTFLDEVELEGAVQIRDQYAYIILRSPYRLKIVRGAAIPTTISEINENFETYFHRRVKVTGRVISISPPKEPYDSYQFEIKDDSGATIRVFIPYGIWITTDKENVLASLRYGTRVSVSGMLTEWAGEPEIIPQNICGSSYGNLPADVVILEG